MSPRPPLMAPRPTMGGLMPPTPRLLTPPSLWSNDPRPPPDDIGGKLGLRKQLNPQIKKIIVTSKQNI